MPKPLTAQAAGTFRKKALKTNKIAASPTRFHSTLFCAGYSMSRGFKKIDNQVNC